MGQEPNYKTETETNCCIPFLPLHKSFRKLITEITLQKMNNIYHLQSTAYKITQQSHSVMVTNISHKTSTNMAVIKQHSLLIISTKCA